MHVQDRYALALAILEGDRDARNVLADLLEEAGEVELAQQARSGRRSRMKTILFVLNLLPCRTTIGYASEILKESGQLNRVVVSAQRWAGNRIDATEAIDNCLQELAALRQPTDTYIQNLHRDRNLSIATSHFALLRLAVEAERLAAEGNARAAAQNQREVRRVVHQIVRQTRDLPPLVAPDGSIRYLSDVDWKFELLKKVLSSLLTTGNDAWPR
jgi:hypothetical protein